MKRLRQVVPNIEVIETMKNGEYHAITSGGKQAVKIVELPAESVQDYDYVPSMGLSRRVKGHRGKIINYPTRYMVIHDKGSTITPDLNRAIKLAIHHSKRTPK